MEKDFYQQDELADFLQEATSDFKMYPSRRTWYSLYNNLHPGRKWPSFAVALFLITAILYMGVSNNNSINSRQRLAENQVETISSKYASLRIAHAKIGTQQKSAVATKVAENPVVASEKIVTTNTIDKNNNFSPANILPAADSTTATSALAERNTIYNQEPVSSATQANSSSNTTNNTTKQHLRSSIENDVSKMQTLTKTNIITFNSMEVNSMPDFKNQETKKVITATEKNKNNNELRSWLEDFAFHNKPKDKSFSSRSSLMYYVTPSIGFRRLSQKNNIEVAPSNSFQAPVAQINNTPIRKSNINDLVTQHSSVSMEAGAALLYKLSNNLSLKAGLQFNYTNYIINATRLTKGVQTDLAVITPAGIRTESKISNYVNAINKNENTLNNSTTQLSIPIGADFKIAGSNKLQWFAGATVQPSLTLGGNGFALSTDNQYYIEDASILRKINLNTSVETYLSYKTGNGIRVIAGPQVRYQFFSTYKNSYNYKENLYNLGVKIGVVKSF